jgi:hypothetical protein
VFIDSAGRESYSTPIVCIPTGDSVNFRYKITMTNIPASNDSAIVAKYLLRSNNFTITFASPGGRSPNGSVYVLDTLDDTTTTYVDSMTYDTMVLTLDQWCEFRFPEDYDYPTGSVTLQDSISLHWDWGVPEVTCYDDSTISFQPFDIAIHESRGYAIGNIDNLNRIYYSDFGRITTWPSDKFINIASQSGDWFVRLLPLGERLLIFRQNSVWQLTGNQFYQFNIDQVMNNVGLSAPRSLASGLNQVFFFHTSGIYQFDRFGGIPPAPISSFIQNSIDSIGSKFQRAWGGMIGNEFWLSVALTADDNEKCYIYAQIPSPHMKSYDFGVMDAKLFDYDTTIYDYRSDRWIIATDNDSLWRWNYNGDADTLDGTERIVATYQSKFFFEGDDREKIHYIDLIGSGVCDSMMITFYRNYGDSVKGFTQIPIDSQLVAMDWHEGEKQRVMVDHITENFSFKIRDYGYGRYKLRGFVIGWTPWDKGKVRP